MNNRKHLSKLCFRIFAVILCFLLLISVPACKSDTVTHPSVITNPGADTSTEVDPEQAEPEQEETEQEKTEQEKTEQAETEQEKTEQEEPEQEEPEQAETEQAETEQEDSEQTDAKPEDEAEKPEEPIPFVDHPFAAEGFKPSETAASTLTASELIKKADLAALKDKTLTLYTAGDAPSFQYVNEEGIVVTEWDWMKEFAAAQGMNLKLVRKTNATSLKAQRIALYAGQDLSLVTLRADELATGMTLCRSAASYLSKTVTPQGISGAVLKQSGNKLFAPIGNVQSLWYNKKLMPEESDPHTLYQNNQWTTEMYTAVHLHALEKSVMPMLMESALPWATLSGKSPLTLRNNKLDSNINAQATQAVWKNLRALNDQLVAFAPDKETTYSLASKNVAMAYTAIPEANGNSYSYVPLPTFESGKSGTVTYCGTFLALPKYRKNADTDLTALVFAEQWCNRYTEALAAKLQAHKISGEAYRAYITLAEQQGSLILRDEAIETLTADYMAGLTDSKADMQAEYDKIRTKLLGLVAKYNINY